jgi:hypothetical protein
MFNKIRTVLFNKEGLYVCWGILKRIALVKQKWVWLLLPWIKRSIWKKALIGGRDKDGFRHNLEETIGSFGGFAKCVKGETRAKILGKADEIVEGYYDILGSGRIRLKPIDWHLDFKSGVAWPKGKFYLKYIQVDYANSADVKVPRELSRSHHMLVLGQAFLLTKDEKYAWQFKKQVENWIEENPLMYSINWGCAMDVAIRAVNWIYALNMFIASPLLDEKFLKKIRISLFEHGYFIFNNLEKKYRNSNNHYFSNLSGLLYLGLLFHSSRQGRRWFEYALLEYYREIRYQFLPSGISYERSVSYNRLMVELVVYPYLLLVRNRVNVPLDIRHRLNTLFDFISHYIKPNGEAPVVGDQDNGRFLPFGIRQQTDHRYLLTIGAILRAAPCLKKYADLELTDAFFMLGDGVAERFAAIPATGVEVGSKVFPDAGFCIMRAKDSYMFITNSGAAAYPDQTSQWGSHAHADLLSFELAVGDATLLVDPGTFVYTSAPEERNCFRGTRMHNTVVVDDQDQHRLSKSNVFRCLEIAEPVDFDFRTDAVRDIFKGSHNGYMRLADPVCHARTIEFNKEASSWEITDLLSGMGKHVFKWYYHFDSDIDFSIEGNCVRSLRMGKPNLELTFDAGGIGEFRKLDDFVSKAYGDKKPSYTLEITIVGECPMTAKTIISIV